jgi:hypothetical protein
MMEALLGSTALVDFWNIAHKPSYTSVMSAVRVLQASFLFNVTKTRNLECSMPAVDEWDEVQAYIEIKQGQYRCIIILLRI